MTAIFWRRALLAGLILGLGFCLYSTLMWLTGLDGPYLSIGQYLDILIIVLPIGVIVQAIRNHAKSGPFPFGQRLLFVIIIGLVAVLVYDPFLYFYHNAINPGWSAWVVDLKREQLQAAGATPEAIAQATLNLAAQQQAQNKMFHLQSVLATGLIIPILIMLVSMPFIRHRTAQA